MEIERIKDILVKSEKQYHRESFSYEDERKQSDEFKKGAEYGRSEVLKKLIQYFNDLKE